MTGVGESFAGFPELRYTPIPDLILDEYLAVLAPAELRVLLYIARRTYGFKKTCDRISLEQLQNGIRRTDGTVLDQGTGLSRRAVLEALRQLERRGLIERLQQRNADGGLAPSLYRLHMQGPNSWE